LYRVSERQIQVFKADSLSVPLNTVGLDVSPAILIPFYDEDSSTLFLTGKVCMYWHSYNSCCILKIEIAEQACLMITYLACICDVSCSRIGLIMT
jgi:hypothetical protein